MQLVSPLHEIRFLRHRNKAWIVIVRAVVEDSISILFQEGDLPVIPRHLCHGGVVYFFLLPAFEHSEETGTPEFQVSSDCGRWYARRWGEGGRVELLCHKKEVAGSLRRMKRKVAV